MSSQRPGRGWLAVTSAAHAQVISSLRGTVTDQALAAAEPHVVDYARRPTPKELRAVIAHVAHSYAPEKVLGDDQDDEDHRRFHASTTIGGIGVGNYLLHPVGHETVMTAIHAASRPVAGDDRTPAQRRADALVTIAELALASGELPVTGGTKPHLTVLVTLPTLTNQPGSPGADYGFGATSGSEWARRIGCNAQIARDVFARDRHCSWPGCDAPPAWCECHHRQHWADGGQTSVSNGASLCRRHHDRVHLRGHAITVTPTGPHQINPQPGSDPDWKGRRNRAGP